MDWKDKLRELRNSIRGENQEKRPVQGPPLAPKESAETIARGRFTDLCLGFDFGTSSTKAVVRLLPSGPAFAIPFEGIADAEQPYLAPTRLAVRNDGSLSLTATNGGGWTEELKVKLMEAPWEAVATSLSSTVSARPIDLAAAYIALVLRAALGWCETSIRPVIGDSNIRWSMNLGIPARDFRATSIREAFYIAALAGWHLARTSTRVNLAIVSDVVERARRKEFKPTDIAREMIDVVPEVAAGVATYAKSPQRRSGAHLFIDVGATTLDVSMFLLNEGANGLQYAFLSADVDSQLGAFRLHRFRADELGRLALEKFNASNPLQPIPETARQCIPSGDEIDSLDNPFQENCISAVRKVVVAAKKKDPAGISDLDGQPKQPIQVLLSGGGVQLPLYQDAIRITGQRVGPGGGLGLLVRPFQEVPLPRPADLRPRELHDADWQRLAVAYGLSYRFEDIGDFIPEISDKPLPRRPDYTDIFVSKDQM